MNKMLTFALVLTTGFALAEDAVTSPRPEGKPKPSREEMFEKMMKATGGFIETEGTGAKIILLDTRKNADNAAVRAEEILRKTFRIPVTNIVAQLAEGACAVQAASNTLKAEKALMVIALVNSDKTSSLAVLPEDRVAVINAAKFGLGASASEKEDRLVKEIWRAIGFIGGVGYATNEASVMQPVSSPVELDNYKFKVLQPMEVQRIRGMMEKYGSKIGRRITYKKACQEGWAPPPTNDYQRAVWDRVMAEKAAATNAPSATPSAK